MNRHGVHRFIANRVPFVVGSDDPGIFDTTPAKEIDWVVQSAGLGPEGFDLVAEDGWRYRSEAPSRRDA